VKDLAVPLGEIATAAKIASVAAKGFSALRRLQPEYAKFWKSFKAELEPQGRDLPWDRLEQLRLDPEFVGEACGLIRGDNQKRKAMRKHIATLAEPPEGSRYDSDEIVEVVMRAADKSAVKAARDDRDVAAQRGRLIEGQITDLHQALLDEFQEFREWRNRLPEEMEKQIERGIEERLERRPLRTRPALPPKDRGSQSPQTEPHPKQPGKTQRAEIELGRILQSDPDVVASLESTSLPSDKLGYRPDFVVKDRRGTNWVIEVKGESALRLPNVQEHVQTLAILTTEANHALPEDWRFAVVTPTDLSTAHTWGDVLMHSEEQAHLRPR
jgi:hypothetical protein